MEEYNYLFKIILIGDANVGKTCLVRRFTKGFFPPTQGPTIGVDFMIKTVEVDGEKVKLQIWDTAGQERFRSLTQSYYHNADAVILTYDITSLKTFNNLANWLSDVQRFTSQPAYQIIVGNKCDLGDKCRQVKFERAKSFAELQCTVALETSAKEAENVDLLFMHLATTLKRNVKREEHSFENNKKEIFSSTRTIQVGEHHVMSRGPLTCCRV